MNHSHSIMNFPTLSGSPTGQLLHSSHFKNVFSDCTSEPALDLNFVQKFSQNNQRAPNEFELISNFLRDQNETSETSQIDLLPETIAEPGMPNGLHDKMIVEVPKAHRSRCHWSHGEVMALFEAKSVEAHRLDAEMPGKKIKYSQERWDEIAEFVKTKGCNKSASQCKDKWEKIFPVFRKIFDWEKQVSAGKPSYWTMLGDEREHEGFPRAFDKELYDAMALRFSCMKSMDLSSIIVDSNDETEGTTTDFGHESADNDTPMFEDSPSLTDDLVPVSLSKKRKARASVESCKQGLRSSGFSKSLNGNRSHIKSAELAERKLSLEEKKLTLAEKKFILEEKKLESTIEIGKGLIASMERMTQIISSMGNIASDDT